MPFVPVHQYTVDWNPKTNTYRIRVSIATANKPYEPPINSESEFIAVLMMLRTVGVEVDTETGEFRLPARSAGS